MLHRLPSRRDVGRKVSPPQPTFMTDDQKSLYLAGLRKNRPIRPAGSRPLPSKSDSQPPVGRHVPPRAESDLSLHTATDERPVECTALESPKSASMLSHRHSTITERSSLARSSKGRPLAQNPVGAIPSVRGRKVSPTAMIAPGAPLETGAYKESGARWMERQEAHSLRQALEVMDKRDEEKRIHDAAQDEAADLVWKHRNPEKAVKEKDFAYRNPDVSRAARFKSQMARVTHERSQSEGYGALGRGVSMADPTTSTSDGSNYSQDAADDPDMGEYAGLKSKKEARVDATINLREETGGGRRRSSGQRIASNQSNTGAFRNAEDQIYEDPEEMSTNTSSKPVQLGEHQTALKSRSRNSLPYGSRPPPEKTASMPVVPRYRTSPFDRQRNLPSHPRASPYMSNEAIPSPSTAEAELPPSKNGIEIRSDDIRAATSMLRKDRSPKLPTPIAVSDRPGRPIVSFDVAWKPPSTSEVPAHGIRELPLRPSPQVPMMTVSAPTGPTSNLLGQTPSALPTINLPDQSDNSPAITALDAPNDDEAPSAVASETTEVPTISSLVQSQPSPRPLPIHSQSCPPKLPNTKRPSHLSLLNGSRSSVPTATCASCTLPIAGRIVTASGSNTTDPEARFHPECFTCHICSTALECVAFYPEPSVRRDERLAESGLESENDALRFFCHLDFHELFSPRCKSCKTPIEGEVIVAAGGEYHVGHFFCAECGDPFESSTPFVEKAGYAYCVSCHRKRTSGRCRGCKNMILEEMSVQALGGDWHEKCFCCWECEGGFGDDGRFFVREVEVEASGKEMRKGIRRRVEERAVCEGCEGRRLKA